MKFKILPYKQASKSAKILASALGCFVLNTKRNTYRGYRNHVIINWGSQRDNVGLPGALSRVHTILNHPSKVDNASNKLRTFQLLGDLAVEHTTSLSTAINWLADSVVFSRTSLNANSGEGIVLNMPGAESLTPAPLYTKNFPKTHEYRVHVFRDDIISFQQKRLKASENRTDTPDDYIWNYELGQRVFARNDIDVTPEVKEQLFSISIQALKKLDLDFGAIDIGYDENTRDIKIFEVNTACGLTGTTISDYANAFRNYLEGL